ncbi:MAG: 6,7-dimethyl-8-ribityllumazine synthase [Gemmatimonadetes bacterium]|nr:6,7-dimethyl-8-ribityllumazine synthase [Gemmatimonadota bacterium]
MATRRRSRSGTRERRRVLVVVSRFNESVTRRLLDGATARLAADGYRDGDVDVVWVPGAFELAVAVHRGLATGRYRCAVALGAVIRGETSHFEYVSAEAARGLGEAATRYGIPVGFGVLTCDTLEQALERAGGQAGNKGTEAAEAALATARALEDMTGGAAR